MKDNYRSQIYLLQAIRDFFNEKGFLDVMTPPAVSNPGMEVHIHPFQLSSAQNAKSHSLYLHTSPEFWMKKLLSEGLEKIFTLSFCFRDEPNSPIHRTQFIMLEWYRTEEFYTKIMDDCFELMKFCYEYLKQKKIPVSPSLENAELSKKSIQEIFSEILQIDILEYLEKEKLKSLIENNFSDVPLPIEECDWEDYFFLLFLNKIEPELKKYPFLILYNYPAQLAALSTINKSDPRVCDRFELYCNGIELANCFNELIDTNEQKKRFQQQAKQKKDLYGYELPAPDLLYESMEKGLPRSSGIALGVERFLNILTDCENCFISDY